MKKPQLNRIIILLIIISSSLARAQTVERIGKAATMEISLADVSRLALENSLDVQIAKYDAYIKRTYLGRAKSIFDTFLRANIDYLKDEKKPQTTLLGDKNVINNYQAAVGKKLPLGTDLELKLGNKRQYSNSPFDTINPAHDAVVGLSLRQPLGKNFFGLADRATVKITKIDIANAEYTSLDNVEQALANVQIAYWNYILKREELSIKQDMRKKAQRLYEIYDNKYKKGLAEKADLLAVAANVRSRDNDVLGAQLAGETAKNDLLFLLNAADLSVQLQPLESLAVDPYGVDLASAVNIAISSRRDYKTVKNMVKANEIDLTVKKNALWPEIDLSASFEKNGLDSDYQEAWDEIVSEDNKEVFVGLEVKFPLENRKARSEKKEASLRKQQLIFMLKRVERLILRELNNTVNEVNTVKNQVTLSGILVMLQGDKLKEEEKRQKYGRSNSDILIRFEEDLLTARLQAAYDLFRYRVSLIDLDLAQNTLLDKYWEEEL